MKEQAKAHNAPHNERFEPPIDQPRDARPTGTGWVHEEPPPPAPQPDAPPGRNRPPDGSAH